MSKIKLHVNDGSAIVYTLVNGSIVINNETGLANSLKKIVTGATKGKSLVNELLSDRKAEVKRD